MWEFLFGLEWGEMFLPSISPLEIFIRGTIVYLGLFAMLRFVLKREAGTVGITDLLVLVLIADAAQNAMASDYTSIIDGLLLVGTIVFWAYFLDWLGYRYPAVQWFVHPPALLLVEHGKMIRHHMRREFITEEELYSILREQGIEDIRRVKRARMEGDGKISVVTEDEGRHNPPETEVH